MENLDIRLTVRDAIEKCQKAEGIEKYHYFSVALVLEKNGYSNPDLFLIYGAVNKDVEDDVAIYDEKKLVEDISYEEFRRIAIIIHKDYEANFCPIISKLVLDITKLPKTYEGLLEIVKIFYVKNEFSRSGIGFRISFDINK